MVDSGTGAGSASLGDHIGQLLGDFTPDEGSAPDSIEPADAGAPPPDAPSTDPPPADAPAGDDATAARPDGEGATPGAATVPPPADGPPAVSDADPLAAATALTYMVDGQARTVEGIRVLGDEAIITRDALPDIQRRLGERDHLYEVNQRQFRERQHLDSLGAWKTTGADGTESLKVGAEGIAEMRVSHARLEATLHTLVSVLQDPAKFRSLVAVDEHDAIVPNRTFLQNLLVSAELAEMKAEQSARTLLGQLGQAAQSAQATPTTPDYAALAPGIIQAAAGPAFATLSAKDQQALAAQMPRYIRPSTPAERQQGHGPQIVDAAFTDAVQHVTALRSDAAKTAVTATAAATSNAARIAAARQGHPPASAPRRASPPPVEPSRRSDADQAWAMRERAAAGVSR